MDPHKVAVGPAVWPRVDSASTNPVPLTTANSALPLAIDFGANANGNDPNALSWGPWLSNWKFLDASLIQYLGEPKYLYRLDLFKNEVVELKTHKIIYQLSAAESAELNTLLSQSILACSPSAEQQYASLETDYGIFDLGADTPCAVVDLFRNDGHGTPSGVAPFLSQLENAIYTVSH